MDQQTIYDKIVAWQEDAGEDFLDYFDSDLRAASYMMWCRGKGYISIEQFHAWEQDLIDNENEPEWASAYVHDCGNYGEPIPYAVVSEPEWTEEGQEKAYMILAEFISESIIYLDRFKTFLEEN